MSRYWTNHWSTVVEPMAADLADRGPGLAGRHRADDAHVHQLWRGDLGLGKRLFGWMDA